MMRPLDKGGMGSVWLARRNDGRFEGVATIKFRAHPGLAQEANAASVRFAELKKGAR